MNVQEILAPSGREAGWMGDSSRGAALGRPNVSGYAGKNGWIELSVTPGAPPFHLVRVAIDSQGYDRGGVYWGLNTRERLFGFIGPVTDIRGFVWATDRDEAKRLVRELHPYARFFR